MTSRGCLISVGWAYKNLLLSTSDGLSSRCRAKTSKTLRCATDHNGHPCRTATSPRFCQSRTIYLRSSRIQTPCSGCFMGPSSCIATPCKWQHHQNPTMIEMLCSSLRSYSSLENSLRKLSHPMVQLWIIHFDMARRWTGLSKNRISI